MKATIPHYLLFSESSPADDKQQWRFVLQSIDGSEQLEAADVEPDAYGERLELLAVVRGLEALEQPSRVTLVTPSSYVNQGLTYGLQEWRANDWRWEHYGAMVPVKNRDLWQRVDRAMGYHDLECRTWRFDLPHTGTAAAASPDGGGSPRASLVGRLTRLASIARAAWRVLCDGSQAYAPRERSGHRGPRFVSAARCR